MRTDLALENVGTVADLPPDPSPIQLLTEGVYKGKKFEVIGRIVYEYDQGGWNEWHIVFSDGTSGWLSDAQLQYAISFLVKPDKPLPGQEKMSHASPGSHPLTQGGIEYSNATMTHASYKGMEGELPFPFYGKKGMLFADLRTTGKEFGTIDYSEMPPLLFIGEWVEYDELQLKNVRKFEGWA